LIAQRRALLVVVLLLASGRALAQGNDVATMLRGNDCAGLDRRLGAVQGRFERGELGEYELRNAFRPFYVLDASADKNLIGCAAGAPKSYGLHLALGIHYKHLGGDARGQEYSADTSQAQFSQMGHYYTLAMREFNASLRLTTKPYMSIFHILDITGHYGDIAAASALVKRANTDVPGNTMVRVKFAVYLMPRWGGSYSQVEEFAARSAREGAPAIVATEIQAVEFEDKAHVLEEQGKQADADMEYQKALRLGHQAGGSFSIDFLPSSRLELCTGVNNSAYCG
jgi:hypothetical protein